MNFRLTAKDVRFILFILMILLFTFTKSFSATCTASVSGNWSSTATWGGSAVPTSADAVVINPNITVTVDGTYTCTSITMNSTTGSGNIINVNSGNITCTGNLSLASTSTTRPNTINITTGTFTVGGTITVATSTAGRIVLTGDGNFIFSNASTLTTNLTLTATSGTVTYNATGNQTIRATTYNNLVLEGSGVKTITGNITINNDFTINNGVTINPGTTQISLGGNLISPVTVNFGNGSGRFILIGTNDQSICSFSQSSTARFYNSKNGGTATMTGNFTCGQYRLNAAGGTLDLGVGFTHTILGQVNFSGGGTLNCNSSILNLNSSSAYTGTAGTINTDNSTINYNGTTQTIIPLTYNNLTLSTSGAKTFPTGTTTVNGVLRLEGTATATVTGTLNYGANASIVYNKSTHTTGNEWPAPFNGSGGVTIESGTVTLGANESLGANDPLTINSGATLNTSASNYSLSLGGDFTISGTLVPNSSIITISNTSTVTYNSAGNQDILPLDYFNLTLGNNSTKTISAATSVSNELNINAGTLVTGGFLTLKSNATSTARVGTNAGTITGNVIVERFIPGGSNKRKWRFLSSPVNVSGSIALSQYIDDILITAPAGSAAGFDVNPFSPTNTASFRTYDETISGVSTNGWTDPTNVTNTIESGIGAEVFVRGTRTLADPYLNWTTPDDVTIDFVGTLNAGTIAPAITYTPSVGGATTSDGFNLVGNPYASTIDFTNAGLTKTNIDNKFWCYNPNTGSYGIYDMDLNDSTNSITRYIASGQAFFIRANAANPAISFTEAIKCAAPGNNYFKGNQSSSTHPIIHIKVSNDSTYADEALVVLDETASCFSGDTHDAGKLFNDALNIYTLSDDNINLTINALPFIKNVDTIRLAVYSYNGSNIMTTEHRMEFTGIENFDPNKFIYLLDNYTNSITNLAQTNSYTFNINADNTSWGKNRFKLLFSTNALGINSTKLNENIELYPNPASSEINLKFNSNNSNGLYNYQIIDIYGRIVIEGTNETQNQSSRINIESIPSGQYFINIISDSNTSILRFVK